MTEPKKPEDGAQSELHREPGLRVPGRVPRAPATAPRVPVRVLSGRAVSTRPPPPPSLSSPAASRPEAIPESSSSRSIEPERGDDSPIELDELDQIDVIDELDSVEVVDEPDEVPEISTVGDPLEEPVGTEVQPPELPGFNVPVVSFDDTDVSNVETVAARVEDLSRDEPGTETIVVPAETAFTDDGASLFGSTLDDGDLDAVFAGLEVGSEQASVEDSLAIETTTRSSVSASREPAAVTAETDGFVAFDLSFDPDERVSVENPQPEELSVAPGVLEAGALHETTAGEAKATEPVADVVLSFDDAELESDDSNSDDVVELEIDDDIEIELAAPVGPDRGAMLAAAVTSRRKSDEDHSAVFARSDRDEARARMELLVSQAASADDYDVAAEWLAHAAELTEAVTGDVSRAKVLAGQALALSPTSVTSLRVLRRLALGAGDRSDALEYAKSEAALPLGDEEALTLGVLRAEIAAEAETTETPESSEVWESLARSSNTLGAIAGLFAAVRSSDRAAMGDALGVWSERDTTELGAALSMARARLVEGDGGDLALEVARKARESDFRDVGAALSIARMGLGRGQPEVFAEGLAGLAGDRPESTIERAAEVLRRFAVSLTGEPLAQGVIEDSGVAGWIAAHALRDRGEDASAQVEWGASLGSVEWAARQRGADGPVARWSEAREAAKTEDFAVALSRLVASEASEQRVIEAGLGVAEGGVSEREVELMAEGGGALQVLRGAVRVARREGAIESAAEVLTGEREELLQRFDAAVSRAVSGEVDAARAVWSELAEVASGTIAGLASARALVAWAESLGESVVGLRAEAAASDGDRSADARMVAAAVSAAAGVSGGGTDALTAAEEAPGALAAMELSALFATRGEVDPRAAAMLLEMQGDAIEGLAGRISLVRSGLRRSSTEPDAANEAVWRAWSRGRSDAGLGALVLRASLHSPERAVEVLQARVEALDSSGPGARESELGVALGVLLSEALETAARLPEAARALARARTFDLRDVALKMVEERLWVRAGHWAEVTERAFDRLKEAQTDAERIVAYEQLGEHDQAERNDTASAVLSFQAIVELDPSHRGALRALERYFIEQGRTTELLGVYSRLVETLTDTDEALAYAHVGARLAELTSDTEGAGAEFLRAAQSRGLADRRLMTGLDAEYRRVGDLQRFAEVQLGAAGLAAGELERATYLCRAGEAFEALGDGARARRAFEGAVAAEGASVTALAGVARVCAAMGDERGAAEAWEALGQRLRDASWASKVLLRAMAAWHKIESTAGQPLERTLAMARAVLVCDPRHGEAFSQALEILSEREDFAGELELIERFVATGTDDLVEDDAVALYARAASLAEALEDSNKARGLWQAVTTLRPTHEEALRAVSQLSFDAEDWGAAAEAMVKLAKVTEDQREKVELLLGLGDIFDKKLPEAKKAEAAWRRLMQLQPDDLRAPERLAEFYARTGERAKEIEILQVLVPRTAPGPLKLTRLLRLGRVADETGEEATSRSALDAAERELRAAVDRDPRDAVALGQFIECLSLSKRADAARSVASVRAALGLSDGVAETAVIPGAGAMALDSAGLDLLAPPAVPGALREVLSRVAPVVDAVLPYDMSAVRAERLGARPHGLRAEIERWAEVLALGDVEILLVPELSERCLPIERAPATVIVAASVADDPAGRFAVARAMLLMAMGLSLPLRMSLEDFSLALAAVFRQFEPMFKLDGVDLARLDEVSRAITRGLSREAKSEAEAFAFDVLERSVDAAAIKSSVLECGDRVALLATGDLRGALGALGARTGERTEVARVIDEKPVANRLVRVALSERYFEARHVTGAAER